MSQTEPTETLYGAPAYETNPFLETAYIATTNRKLYHHTNGFDIVNTASGEVLEDNVTFTTNHPVDAETFVKVYTKAIAQHADLGAPGRKIFTILFKELSRNHSTDKLQLAYKLMTEIDRAQISRATFKRGIQELIEKRFIARRTAAGAYWLNPEYMYNGNRLTLVENYFVQKTEQQREQIQQPKQLTQRHVDPRQTDIEDFTK